MEGRDSESWFFLYKTKLFVLESSSLINQSIYIMALTTGNEDKVTKEVEQQTSKIPSILFLAASLAAMGISAALKCCKTKDDNTALFVGQWAAPFLLLGIYNKIVKTEGHD
jgi:hypothetical protein